MREIILVIIFILRIKCEKSKIEFSCSELHSLYDEGKHLVNIRRLYDNLLIRNHVVTSNTEIGYAFFNSEFSQAMSYNISEEFYKSRVFT